MRNFLLILFAFIAVCALGSTWPEAKFPRSPFWKKERIQKRLLEERAIVISVKADNIPLFEAKKIGKSQRMELGGVGIVNATPNQSFKKLAQFGKWPSMSDYIKEVRWQPESQRLYLHMAAYKYHAKMLMKVRFGEVQGRKVIHFFVEKGSFQGLRAAMKFEDAIRRKTEISMTAQYEFDKLPMPQFFLEFGMEIVFQKVAEKLRAFIEDKER